METAIKDKPQHIGKKIERIRKLRGLTQEDIGRGLGISKQAVSKLEQSETIEEERLNQIANALGVTVDGLKGYKEDSILYYTANFYEGSSVTNSSVNTHEFNIINPLEKIIELYENLLKSEREKVEILLNKKTDQ
jgi:transcriptional regulator with XRE-family HTH domain